MAKKSFLDYGRDTALRNPMHGRPKGQKPDMTGIVESLAKKKVRPLARDVTDIGQLLGSPRLRGFRRRVLAVSFGQSCEFYP